MGIVACKHRGVRSVDDVFRVKKRDTGSVGRIAGDAALHQHQIVAAAFELPFSVAGIIAHP